MSDWTLVFNLLFLCGCVYLVWCVVARIVPQSARLVTSAGKKAGRPIKRSFNTQQQRRGCLFAVFVHGCGWLGIFTIVGGVFKEDTDVVVSGVTLLLIAIGYFYLYRTLQKARLGRTRLPGRSHARPSRRFTALQKFLNSLSFKGGHGSELPLTTVNIWLVIAGMLFYMLTYFFDF